MRGTMLESLRGWTERGFVVVRGVWIGWRRDRSWWMDVEMVM